MIKDTIAQWGNEDERTAQDLSEFATDGMSAKEEVSEGELSEGEIKIVVPSDKGEDKRSPRGKLKRKDSPEKVHSLFK
jgi:hypothetical protein